MSLPAARIKFKIIDLLSKKMIAPSQSLTAVPKMFHFDILVDTSVNTEQKIIVIVVDIKIKEVNKEIVQGELSLACGFEVENFEETILKDDKTNMYIVPPDTDALVKSVSISTARGVLFSEFRGTYLMQAIMPIIIFPPIAQAKQQMTAAELFQPMQ